MSDLSRLLIVALGPMMLIAAALPLPTGTWSGRQVTLTLDATGGTLIEDCQTATLNGPVRRAADGGFVAEARREVHSGGPQLADVAPTTIPVRLNGRMVGEAMVLDIVSEGAAPQRLELLPGRRTKMVRCY